MALMLGEALARIAALMRKDVADLSRRPGAVLPAFAMAFGALAPAFFVVVGAPFIAGRGLAESDEFTEAASSAVELLPEIASLTDQALIQAFLFHQFALLLLLVPVVASMTLATHAVIGEKQSRSLEPLLATPLSTAELLAAKTLTPLLFAALLMWTTLGVYVAGVWLAAEPGVWLTLLSARSFLMFVWLGPLAALSALLLSVIVSSRVNDARSAQQLASLILLPITAAFVLQMIRFSVVGNSTLMTTSIALAIFNLALLWAGVRVFRRETILTRWR
ncbi:MAG: ABC transporter permease [Vicinamibacterales bacterium]